MWTKIILVLRLTSNFFEVSSENSRERVHIIVFIGVFRYFHNEFNVISIKLRRRLKQNRMLDFNTKRHLAVSVCVICCQCGMTHSKWGIKQSLGIFKFSTLCLWFYSVNTRKNVKFVVFIGFVAKYRTKSVCRIVEISKKIERVW